ncbi:thiamine pyrophosphate-binding protein [Actinosynnema mirum]|uniref:Thiamine pyrophosphate protein central region n=1 Tax=Actinosynnema mirum (strain ATCC 29888 / DSM 43827 / JCM 3225 / NBRC 14064 / NCIMB 13271 / NRRL B-12336 / IMRU 3971 / 101) TaxID=446462 RepID=C6WPI3_ACTMD|nr:thiamine pyrophosphate-binding protein [Actinosynnema mirum]ACU38685.1 thiamine pyrophosphate protein central region [Actinosynnema mirum DSM 43827]
MSEDGVDCWSAVADVLAATGCSSVFGLPSDEPGLLDAADAHPGLRAWRIGDQRTAACAAAGHAMVSGRPVALAVNSGPGFANALAGLLEASSLAVPLVLITTSVPSEGVGRGGFQHVDQQRMLAPLTSWQYEARSAEVLTWAVERAVRLAVDGRAGITAVEIADEVLRAPVPAPVGVRPVLPLRSTPSEDALERATALLDGARRPVVLAGGGCRWSAGSGPAVVGLAERLGAPVLTTAAGRGVVPETHPLALGLVGLYTTPPAGEVLAEADALLVLGSRLEETARMGWDAWRSTPTVQVDKSAAAFGEGCSPEVALLGDVALTAGALTARVAVRDRAPWSERVRGVALAQEECARASFARSPVRAAVRLAQRELGRLAVVVQDNGLHDMWSYHYPVLRVEEGTTVVCPGEQTLMGFGLAASVGASAGTPEGSVCAVFTGDSAFRLSAGALESLREQGSGVVVVVFDDAGFGWPRRLRLAVGADTRVTEVSGGPTADELAAVHGGWGATARTEAELVAALRTARDRAVRGGFSVVRVPAADDDVPVGVLEMEREGHA